MSSVPDMFTVVNRCQTWISGAQEGFRNSILRSSRCSPTNHCRQPGWWAANVHLLITLKICKRWCAPCCKDHSSRQMSQALPDYAGWKHPTAAPACQTVRHAHQEVAVEKRRTYLCSQCLHYLERDRYLITRWQCRRPLQLPGATSALRRCWTVKLQCHSSRSRSPTHPSRGHYGAAKQRCRLRSPLVPAHTLIATLLT